MDVRGKEKGFADGFYISQQWRQCREGYLQYVGGLCEDCLQRGLIVPADEVHHKTKITPQNINDPRITLNWGNLRALCKECHMMTHRKPKRWKVDTDGNVTPGDPPWSKR